MHQEQNRGGDGARYRKYPKEDGNKYEVIDPIESCNRIQYCAKCILQ